MTSQNSVLGVLPLEIGAVGRPEKVTSVVLNGVIVNVGDEL